MHKIIYLAASLLAVCSCCCNTAEVADYQTVPLPQSITMTEGNAFKLCNCTAIVSAEETRNEAELLAKSIEELTGLKLKIKNQAPAKNYILVCTGYEAEAESYELNISETSIIIKGSDAAGAFHGIQTLCKSLPVAGVGEKLCASLPAACIQDSPRFKYRGLHLDVARHIFSVDFVKKYIDLMALHNMNYFHWHLTEDQGWRVEIKAYPQLTEIGGYRNGTMVGKDWDSNDGIRYGGYYTQEEIKDVVAYAAERHITIIPEVDLPGHMLAALAAMPELGCTGGPYEVCHKWGVFPDVLCAGNDKVYEFLDTVLGEMCELFPGEYFHIGGDECPKTRWHDCPKCQAKIKELGIKGTKEYPAEEQLQSYVMSYTGNFLASKGKKIIGWDELLEGGAVEDVTVMSWRGEKGGVAGAKLGKDVIMTPNSYLYFDYYQADQEKEPLAIGGYLPLDKVYSYEPISGPLAEDAGAAAHIIGVQANVWTEYMTTEDYVEYMLVPRIDALSEIQWSNAGKDFEGFTARLQHMGTIYNKLGYNYAKHFFNAE